MADSKTTNIKITLHDNSPEVLAALDKAIYRALWAMGAAAEGHAKENAPVDTGLLRNSITFAVGGQPANITQYEADREDSNGVKKTGKYTGKASSGTYVEIGSNVEYAIYQELGKPRGKHPHFLKNAVANHTAEYKNLLKESMKNV